MSKNKSQAYALELTRKLENSGWKLAAVENAEEDFAIEHRIYQSVRQALGLKIILSFVRDPQFVTDGPLVCIRAGTNYPKYWHDMETEVSVFYVGGKEPLVRKMNDFVARVNDYRNQVHEGTGKKVA